MQEKVFKTRNGVHSFFPQEGVFSSIVANNNIKLIKSIEIKSKLLELYDYKYRRNKNADFVMENYFQYDASKFFSSKFKLIASYGNQPGILMEIELDMMESNYEEFRMLLDYIYPHTIVVKRF